MKQNAIQPNVQGYSNEPENYSEVRKEIEALIRNFNQCGNDLCKLLNYALVSEEFDEQIRQHISETTAISYTLGRVYGYLLADDIKEEYSEKLSI